MIKKVLPWIVFILLFAMLIIGFSLKDSMNNYLSGMMQKQASPELIKSGNTLVDSLYNYSTNGLNYKITFIEFGAKNCSACKRMEKVLEEVRKKYPGDINVVFLNILKPQSQVFMKLYGIASIPTQILLNETGDEFFRHSGFISFEELEKQYSDNSF